MAYIDLLIGYENSSRVIGLISLVCLYPVTLWIYNLFFHPLAKFPGPILWRASRLPYMRAVWGGHFPYVVQKLHLKYGDVVRTAPNELSFAAPSAWDDIYSNREGANSQAFHKSELWHGTPDGETASVFTTTDLKEHARIRRFMDPAFSERAVLQQEPILQEYVDLCIQKLHKQTSATGRTTVNVIDWIDFTLFDIIGDLCFGESFDCLKECQHEDWMTHMNAAIKLHWLSINLRHYPVVTTLLGPLMKFLIPKDIIEKQKDYYQRSTAKLSRRLLPKKNINRPDIVSKLIRNEDRVHGLTPDEVTVNSMLFINAASETTATTLTGAINNLLQNPQSLSILEREVRESELTLSALKQLPYLNAVLKEALRMCNATPTGHMRITPPEGGIVLGNHVAGNTLVTIQPLTLYLSPKYFHEAHVWHPERWLHDAETNPKSPYYNDHRKGVRPFGWGPQNCVGEPLAWAWMRLIIANMVSAFDLCKANTPNAKVVWEKQDVYAVINKHRLDVLFAERTDRT